MSDATAFYRNNGQGWRRIRRAEIREGDVIRVVQEVAGRLATQQINVTKVDIPKDGAGAPLSPDQWGEIGFSGRITLNHTDLLSFIPHTETV